MGYNFGSPLLLPKSKLPNDSKDNHKCILIYHQRTSYNDFHLNTVTQEIERYSMKHIHKQENHSNSLALNLLDNSDDFCRLKRVKLFDLRYQFNEQPFHPLFTEINSTLSFIKITSILPLTQFNFFIPVYLKNFKI